MRPYSKDLRDRVAATIDEGAGSLRPIARRFRVSLSFVARLLRRRRQTGSLDPAPHGGGQPPALTQAGGIAPIPRFTRLSWAVFWLNPVESAFQEAFWIVSTTD